LMTKEIGVAPVPGSSFFAHAENRYIRLNFAKKAATLHAAGERLMRLKRQSGLPDYFFNRPFAARPDGRPSGTI